uniref:EF-hand calcium-binding domain-containing protein 4B-like n=1 Tax=Sinocyclocheilus rhinocerous TaxID=307959 RepID=A0A673IXX9_9TELE
MSETEHVRSTRVINSGSDQDDKQLQPRKSENKEAGWGHIAMLDKIEDFFQICDSEGKGFITRTDMRRLHEELPLTTEELESVFDSLDLDKNGYLTLGEFSSGFSMFIISFQKGEHFKNDLLFGTIFLAQQMKFFQGVSMFDDEERHFCMLMESLGASNVFDDPSEVRSLWAQLRKDEPRLLSNFEEFLARVTYQIKEARQERKEMETLSALVSKCTGICLLHKQIGEHKNSPQLGEIQTLTSPHRLHTFVAVCCLCVNTMLTVMVTHFFF